MAPGVTFCIPLQVIPQEARNGGRPARFGRNAALARRGKPRQCPGLQSALRPASARSPAGYCHAARPPPAGARRSLGCCAGNANGGLSAPGGLFGTPAHAVSIVVAQDRLRTPPHAATAARPCRPACHRQRNEFTGPVLPRAGTTVTRARFDTQPTP